MAKVKVLYTSTKSAQGTKEHLGIKQEWVSE